MCKVGVKHYSTSVKLNFKDSPANKWSEAARRTVIQMMCCVFHHVSYINNKDTYRLYRRGKNRCKYCGVKLKGESNGKKQIAKLCHWVNKAYCESVGDKSQPNWDDAPEWQKQSAVNGVEFHHGESTTPEGSHNNWLKQKQEDGWKYGPDKDPVKKEHPCCVPYSELPQAQKSKDYIFKAICDFFRTN